jgi:hypothetical protein
VGFVVDKVTLGQVSSEYLGFPSQFAFHRLLHTHHLSSGAGTIGQIEADVLSGLSLTPPQETKMVGGGGLRSGDDLRATVGSNPALRLAVYRQSVRLSVKPLEALNQRIFLSTEPLQ